MVGKLSERRAWDYNVGEVEDADPPSTGLDEGIKASVVWLLVLHPQISPPQPTSSTIAMRLSIFTSLAVAFTAVLAAPGPAPDRVVRQAATTTSIPVAQSSGYNGGLGGWPPSPGKLSE